MARTRLGLRLVLSVLLAAAHMQAAGGRRLAQATADAAYEDDPSAAAETTSASATTSRSAVAFTASSTSSTLVCALRLIGMTSLNPDQGYNMLVATNGLSGAQWDWQDSFAATPGVPPKAPAKAARRSLLQTSSTGNTCRETGHFTVTDLDACKAACGKLVSTSGGTTNPIAYASSIPGTQCCNCQYVAPAPPAGGVSPSPRPSPSPSPSPSPTPAATTQAATTTAAPATTTAPAAAANGVWVFLNARSVSDPNGVKTKMLSAVQTGQLLIRYKAIAGMAGVSDVQLMYCGDEPYVIDVNAPIAVSGTAPAAPATPTPAAPATPATPATPAASTTPATPAMPMPTKKTTTAEDPSSSGGSTTGVVIGVTVGIIVIVVCIAIGAVCVKSRKRGKKTAVDAELMKHQWRVQRHLASQRELRASSTYRGPSGRTTYDKTDLDTIRDLRRADTLASVGLAGKAKLPPAAAVAAAAAPADAEAGAAPAAPGSARGWSSRSMQPTPSSSSIRVDATAGAQPGTPAGQVTGGDAAALFDPRASRSDGTTGSGGRSKGGLFGFLRRS